MSKVTPQQLEKAANIIRKLASHYTDEILVHEHEDGIGIDGDVYDLVNGFTPTDQEFQAKLERELRKVGLAYEKYMYSYLTIYKETK